MTFATVVESVYTTDLKSVGNSLVGSSPTSRTKSGISLMVEPQPSKLTARVRFSHPAPILCAISSDGRASPLQGECRQFDPVIAHQILNRR